jgi:hypothetical protein
VTGRIKSLKNSSDSIGYRTRDLPVCSAVSQPATPRTPLLEGIYKISVETLKCMPSLEMENSTGSLLQVKILEH